VGPLLIVAACLYLIPTIIWGVIMIADGPARELPRDTGRWIGLVVSLCIAGCACSLLASPMYAAVMFARERRDRSADLVATLPLPRARLVVSKLIITVAATLTPIAFTALALTILGTILASMTSDSFSEVLGADPDPEVLGLLLAFAGMTTLSIGAGWLLSTILRSETAAGGLALLVTVVTAVTIALVLERLKLSVTLGAKPYYVISFSGGALGLIAGTIAALIRKTP
jgi:ABC-type transport system involved in multi-copper enzyme maturation permease subunit